MTWIFTKPKSNVNSQQPKINKIWLNFEPKMTQASQSKFLKEPPPRLSKRFRDFIFNFKQLISECVRNSFTKLTPHQAGFPWTFQTWGEKQVQFNGGGGT